MFGTLLCACFVFAAEQDPGLLGYELLQPLGVAGQFGVACMSQGTAAPQTEILIMTNNAVHPCEAISELHWKMHRV